MSLFGRYLAVAKWHADEALVGTVSMSSRNLIAVVGCELRKVDLGLESLASTSGIVGSIEADRDLDRDVSLHRGIERLEDEAHSPGLEMTVQEVAPLVSE